MNHSSLSQQRTEGPLEVKDMQDIVLVPALPLFYLEMLKWLPDNFVANVLRSVFIWFGTTLSY